jgi:putative DNA primase/helicase
MTDTRAIVTRYIERGLAPIPVPAGSKNPNRRGWQNEQWTVEDVPHQWTNGQNVGLLTGEPSDWLVTVDLDVPEATKIAGRFLKPTLTSGRESTPHSHWWYRAPGAKTEKWKDLDGETLLELRSTGCQTLVEPSVHPDNGERYRWHRNGEAEKDDPNALSQACRQLATATLVARHLPPIGGRHDYGLAVAGFLLRANRLDEDTVLKLLKAAWDAKGWPDELKKREAHRDLEGIVHDTVYRLVRGDEVVGGRTLEDTVQGLPRAISTVWGWTRNERQAEQQRKKPEPPTHDELRDRWLETNPDHAYGLGEWRRYQHGVWRVTKQLIVEASIMRVLESAKPEGIKPNGFVLSSVHKLARIEAYKDDEVWDSDPNIIVAANGAIDIARGVLLPHSTEHYCTTRVPYAFDEDAEASNWTRFIGDIDKDVASFLQEFAGYCLTTDTSLEKAVWLVGPPGGGKSTLLEGFIAMLGERAGVLGLAEIEKSPFAVAKLIGKTLVTAAEQPAGFVSCHHVLNAIISGEMIQVERKYQNPYDIVPRAKIVWAMNETPRIPSGAEGLFRRVEVIRLPEINKKDRDPTLKEGIKREGAGVLVWALEGLKRLRQRGRFEVPTKVEQDTEEFRQNNDIPGLFVAERCIEDCNASEKASELYKEYKFWCEDNGHRPKSSTSVAEDWQRLGFERYRSSGTSRYRGVRVRLPGE